MNGFIYKITNDINDKVYIGKTLSTIKQRFKEHKSDSTRLDSMDRPLYRAMNKYGTEHFMIETIEEVPLEQLSEREQYWIDYFQSYHNGYNATRGGDGKQLYDYDAIVQSFLSGKLVRELAEEFECCTDTIGAALALAHIDSKSNANKSLSKAIVAFDIATGEEIQCFGSRVEAARWLQNQGRTRSSNLDNIVAAIGRAANGQRKQAYGMIWKNN